jgi:cold shock CspA family protein
MKLPLQVTFRNTDPLEGVEACIRSQVAKLEIYYDRVMSCRVIVEVPHRHHHEGNQYHIRIDLTVPGGEVVVKKDASLHATEQQIDREKPTKCEEIHTSHKLVNVAIREAFEAARRRLQDYARRQRGDVKVEEPTAHARVSRLFRKKGYGFLETPDGREIYFHRNSVLDGHFRCLEIGTRVMFAEEQGEKGLQASSVRYAARHHGRGLARKSMRA